jgi:hypothetical protein
MRVESGAGSRRASATFPFGVIPAGNPTRASPLGAAAIAGAEGPLMSRPRYVVLRNRSATSETEESPTQALQRGLGRDLAELGRGIRITFRFFGQWPEGTP